MANVTLSLMYNEDLFKDAGIDTPPTKVAEAWSWQEFLEKAQELTLDSSGRNSKDPNFYANNIT